VDIVVFGKTAEHCGQYLSKGNGVIVDGRLQQRRWETEDGQKRSKHEIVAQTVTFLPKRQDGGGGDPGGPGAMDEPGFEEEPQG
jgi:single-strand DNA-binding protein